MQLEIDIVNETIDVLKKPPTSSIVSKKVPESRKVKQLVVAWLEQTAH